MRGNTPAADRGVCMKSFRKLRGMRRKRTEKMDSSEHSEPSAPGAISRECMGFTVRISDSCPHPEAFAGCLSIMRAFAEHGSESDCLFCLCYRPFSFRSDHQDNRRKRFWPGAFPKIAADPMKRFGFRGSVVDPSFRTAAAVPIIPALLEQKVAEAMMFTAASRKSIPGSAVHCR